MAIEHGGGGLRQLNTLFTVGVIGGLTDAQLLERFTSQRDEAAELAFRALMERHGPMVLRVCRAVLRDTDAAADCFQATFLVLVRRAGSLWVQDLLGPWLHHVAYRTACCARSAAARRRRHEHRATEWTARQTDDGDRDDLGPMVHEEVGRLPARYRDAVVLCLLEGLTPEQAARQLGCPVGTVHSRLARGREQLRGRLTRRGLAVPTGLLAAGMARDALSATVPTGMADSTIRAALQIAMGRASTGAVPASVATLTAMTLRTMLMAKIRMTVATLLLGGLLAVTAGVLARQGASATPHEKKSKLAAKSAAASEADPLPAGALLRLGTSRFRSPSIVSELALSPDEKTVVTVSDVLIAWDAETGRERWRVRSSEYGSDEHSAAYGMRALAFSADGARFYTPGRLGQNEVVVWDTASGRREVLTIATPSRVGAMEGATRSVDVTPDGQKLAVGNGHGLVVCGRLGKVLYEIANPHGAFQIQNNDRLGLYGHYSLGRFAPDGSILAVVVSASPDEIRLYNAATGRELRKVSLGARLVRMAFSPDGKQLVTTERDNAVRLYDVATCARNWSHIIKLTNIYENYTSAVSLSPDGKTLAVCATDHHIYLMNAMTGAELGQLSGHHWYPWALAFSANSKMLNTSGWDPTIRRWDVAAREQLALPAGKHATGVVAASPDGKTLSYEDDFGTIRVVDSGRGTERCTLTLAGCEYSQLTFSPDGRRLAGGGTSGEQVHVAVWTVPDGRLLHRWDWPKGRDPHSTVEALAFTPDGRRLAAAVFRQSIANVWDLPTGQQIAHLAHNQVYALSFSPDGQTLATAGWDSIIRFWNTDTGNLRREVKPADRIKGDDLQGAGPAVPPPPPRREGDLRMFSVCYAPAGGLIATMHLDGLVRIWQADEMLLRKQFQIGGWGYGRLRFSPDGLWLAGGVRDGSVEIWDPLSAERVWNVGRHQNDVDSVSFGRDARTLVSGGDDGLCYVWDLRPPRDRPDRELTGLWDDLAGENGLAAYQAMWSLSDMGDRAVSMVAERLRAVTTVIDLDHVDEGKSTDEIDRLRRMKRLLITKDPNVESAIAVRRAISLLAQIGTPAAIGLIKNLVERKPRRDVAQIAASALDRLAISKTP